MFGFKRSIVQAVVILAWALKYYSFGNVLLWWVLAVLLSAAVLLAVTTYDHDYWASRGVFSPPAWPIVGHILSVVTFKEQGGMCFKRIYDTYRNERFLGTHQFYQRTLVVRDPELIKRICVNDFQHFVDRGFFFNKDVDPLAGSVLFLRGNEWKRLRAKISPIFSPNKLRGMFPLIDNTAKEFVVRVEDLLTSDAVEINAKNNDRNQINRYKKENSVLVSDIKQTVNNENVVSQNGDHEHYIKDNINSFQKSELEENGVNNNTTKENGIRDQGPQINGFSAISAKRNGVAQNGKNSHRYLEKCSENKEGDRKEISAVVDSEKLVGGYTADAIVPCAFGLKSNVMYDEKDPFAVALQAFYEMSVFNIFEKTMRQFWPAFVLFFRMRIIPKKTHDFFYNIVKTVLRAREKGEQEKRGDFIDMMMALRGDHNNNKADGDDVEITDMVISANAFIIFLGGFETTSSTLAFLCLELAAHPAVQERLRAEVRGVVAGRSGHEALAALVYMEMVIQETLRLYPPFPSIQRMCTKDYTIPGTSTLVERGTIVLFPTLGIQRDEQYFEDAKRFNPDRWAEGRPQPPPGVYMPFGDGPRYCIGKRFAMIQMKCCLVQLLQRVRIEPASANMLAELRAEPFAADPRSPLTLHPAHSLVRLTLL